MSLWCYPQCKGNTIITGEEKRNGFFSKHFPKMSTLQGENALISICEGMREASVVFKEAKDIKTISNSFLMIKTQLSHYFEITKSMFCKDPDLFASLMMPQFSLTEETKTEEHTAIDKKIKFYLDQSLIQAERRDSKRSLLVTKYEKAREDGSREDFL